MSLDRRVLCARRSRHLREAPEHIDPPDDRTRQAGARPRPNPKRPWELMRRTHALNHNTANKTLALALAHRLWLSLTRHLRARLPRGRNPYYCYDCDYE